MKPFVLVSILCCMVAGGVHAVAIGINEISPPAAAAVEGLKLGQLPDSKIAKGDFTVYLGGATNRYRHGILGDMLEASELVVEMDDGSRLVFELPDNRVFEDLRPRLADLNNDGIDEILVIESDKQFGSSLSVFAVNKQNIVRMASTPFIGKANRWLNPVGVGDFNGDGSPDIALVSTPHIGGILKLYNFRGSSLIQFASYPGVSTHRIGSRELGLGQIVSGEKRDLLLLPNQSHEVMLLLEWTPAGITELARLKLPGRLKSSLHTSGENRWTFSIASGQFYEIRILDE